MQSRNLFEVRNVARCMRLLCALLFVSLLGPAAAARADWGPPLPLSPAGEDAHVAGVAAGADDRPAVLLESTRAGGWSLALRTTDRRGRLGAPVTVSASRNSMEGAGLFAGRGRDLVAGWLEIVHGSRRPVVATGPHLTDRQVLAAGPRSTQVMRMAANRRGDAVVAFWRYDAQSYAIYAAFRPAGGRFGAPELVASGRVGNPAVAIDDHGAAVVAWTDPAGVHVAERAAGADRFAATGVPSPEPPTSEAGVAVEGGRVIVAWVVGGIGDARTVLVAERAAASARFAAPVPVSDPGVRIPHWIAPSASLADGRALVAWVEGVLHTTAHDHLALAIRSRAGAWQPPIARGVRAPEHVFSVGLSAAAPGRRPILALTTSRASHLGLATAALRRDGTLGPSRRPAVGGPVGFGSWLAQGRRHAWLATERTVGHARRPHDQALLFRSD